MKKVTHYSTYCALAGAGLYFAWHLSRGDRGGIDWLVLALIGGALLYNLIMLGRRLYAAGGAKAVWHLQRTLLFWIIGLFNTLLLRPEDSGSWKNVLGWVFIALATADSIALFFRERRLCTERMNSEE